MRPVYDVLLPLFIVFYLDSTTEALSGHGLVNPQSACNIRCENGGMCAFSFENPNIHSCICLMGVYEGDRCQYQVGVSRKIVQQTQQAPPPPPPTPVVNYDMRRMEAERQREEQRRRDYERRLEAERRRIEEGRRVGVMPVATRNPFEDQRRNPVEDQRRNPVEDQRIEELRRRDEELRRIAARRREEERRRQQEQRAREEQQRHSVGHQEEQRIRDQEQRRRAEAEQRQMAAMKEQEERMDSSRSEADVSSTTIGHGDEHDVGVPPDLINWEYKSEEVDDTPEDDYLPTDQAEEIEDDVTEKHGSMNDDHEHEEADATTVSEGTITEQGIEEERDTVTPDVLSGVTKAIEEAADKTVKVHMLDIDIDSHEHDDDDYWDHSIKREDEDYEVPRVADSDEESHLTPTPATTGGVREFTAEEGEEGWMMMKRVDENSASTATLTFCLTVMLLTIIRI
uniref:EGF-like domain-containing protein n=1 Tax=Haemonchus contortus TaxID=6289 RepID=A0A7I4YBS3_HAECO|nr:Protein T05G5.1, isoform a [Haemonchus contortus]